MSMINSDPEKMNLSFSGCGFLCIYHAGVAAAIKEYAPQLMQNKISGASAGAIIAAGLVCNVCISQATSTILTIVSQARSRTAGPLHPEFDLLGITKGEIKRTLPPDAYKRCTNKLFISLTRWRDKKNVVVSEFDSNEDLIDAIICSCFIPIYCGLTPPTYRGEQYIDGGFTDNQPIYDEHTVTVSPFSGESDICPPDWDSASFLCIEFSNTSIRCTTRNLFRVTACLMPPSTEDCSKMCLQGFEDTIRFLTRNGMVPCIRCLTIQTNNEGFTLEDPEVDVRCLSPQQRNRNRSASNLQSISSRRRMESECDTCCESEHMYNSRISEVFPSFMRKKFEDAIAAEKSMLDYILSFRLVRYARTCLGLSKLPIDMLLILARNISQWMTHVIAPEWLRRRFTSILDFIYSEIDIQRHIYQTRFSCQLALTEAEEERVRSSSKMMKDLEGIEMSDDAKKELASLREKDKRKRAKSYKSPDPPEPRPISNRQVSRDWTWVDDSANTDSLQHVIEYGRNHDSMYEFHYRDEQNKMHSYELFNMASPDRKHNCHSSAREPIVKHSRPVSMVCEEDEDAHKREEDDSGLSVEEPMSKQTRDACCSPVRHLAGLPPRSSFKRTPPISGRRHATGGGGSAHPSSGGPPPATRKPSSSRDVPNLLSSDSDAEVGEKFFVPKGRQRTSSREYEGEPEQSDTDQQTN